MAEDIRPGITLDVTVPYCVNCKYAIESKTGPSFNRCGYFQFRSVVTGEMENNYCSDMRKTHRWDDPNMKCGIEGKWFEEKPAVALPPAPLSIPHIETVSVPSDAAAAREAVLLAMLRPPPRRKRKIGLMERIFGV